MSKGAHFTCIYLGAITNQQNQSIMTPKAASPTLSEPPLAGYIHSMKFLYLISIVSLITYYYFGCGVSAISAYDVDDDDSILKI